MTIFGRLIAILNSDQLLVRISEDHLDDIETGSQLTVFDSIANESIADLGLVNIIAPKGKIELVMQQSEDVFLARVFEEGGELIDSPMSNFANLFHGKVRVGSKRSALISEDDTLGIQFTSTLKTGDMVGVV